MVNIVGHSRMPRNIKRTIHSFFKVVLKSEYLAPTFTCAGVAACLFTGVIISITVHKIYYKENCDERWIRLNTTGNYLDYHTVFFF